MSLLLDALKKAADDKQKASQQESSDSAPAQASPEEQNKSESIVSNNEILVDELSLQETDDSPVNDEPDAEALDELILDEVTSKDSEHGTSDELENARPEKDELYLEQSKEDKAAEARGYTVSDEALSMLIYKTNRDVKYGRRIFIISALFFSMAILVSGGIYYYLDMQAEIAALERKHQIAMQSMRSRTSREKTPEKSEIIRNLVSESDLNEKVQYAKQQIANEKRPARKPAKLPVNASVSTASKTNNTRTATSTFSIQKTKKVDPVGEKLDAAWLAYESGKYKEAEALYDDVLTLEKSNRDALLGLGAIAVKEKNSRQARSIYLSLLEQDPRDPIATAALASLYNGEASLKTDEEYLVSMLQKNPGAAHLNFALGNNYAQQNKWQSAQQHYFNAWQIDSENADYIFNLAVSMDQLSKKQQAINFYESSLLKAENKQVSFSLEAVKKRIQELSGL